MVLLWKFNGIYMRRGTELQRRNDGGKLENEK